MSTPAHAVRQPVGRKPMTDAEKKAAAANRDAEAEARKKKLAAMSDSERVAFINAERTASFKSLGSLRVTKAVIAISRIKNLAGRNYNFTAYQAEKVINLLQDEVDAVTQAFKARLSGGAIKAAKAKIEL